jgi:hypothetical protein
VLRRIQEVPQPYSSDWNVWKQLAWDRLSA